MSPSAPCSATHVGERTGSPRRTRPTHRGSAGRSGAGGCGRTSRGAGTRARRSRRRRSACGVARDRDRAAARVTSRSPVTPGVLRARVVVRSSRPRSTSRRDLSASSGLERADDAARAAVRDELAVVVSVELVRAAVRDDDHRADPSPQLAVQAQPVLELAGREEVATHELRARGAHLGRAFGRAQQVGGALGRGLDVVDEDSRSRRLRSAA